MKKILLAILLTAFLKSAFAQKMWLCKAGETSFFSETPMENISAVNKKVAAIIDESKNEIAVKMVMIDFKFKNHLMEEHFNENYMESEKYPNGTFKGKINEKIDFSKNGTYNVTSHGTLMMHGVAKERDLAGKMVIENGVITLTAAFNVHLKDHKIEIPTIVMAKIAEEIAVKCNWTFTPKN